MQHELIATKIRENLASQQQQLTQYITLLESIESDIKKKDSDNLLAHLKIASNIVEQLYSIKKVLSPLELMYSQSPYKKDFSLDALYQEIANLSKQVSEKSNKNKKMLNEVIEQMRLDINSKQKILFPKNSYSNPDSRVIDIKL